MGMCKGCNDEASVLYDGRCTGCISVESIEVGQAEIDYIHTIMGTPLEDGDLTDMFIKGRIPDQDEVTDDLDGTIDKVISKLSDINCNAKLYRTPISILCEKYKDEIDDGIYKICLLKDYGVTCGGQVVEIEKGAVVYKEIDYYDEDDNSAIDTSDEYDE